YRTKSAEDHVVAIRNDEIVVRRLIQNRFSNRLRLAPGKISVLLCPHDLVRDSRLLECVLYALVADFIGDVTGDASHVDAVQGGLPQLLVQLDNLFAHGNAGIDLIGPDKGYILAAL